MMAALVGVAGIGGCSGPVADGDTGPSAEVSDGFDVSSLTWDPELVAANTPGLVGWQRSGPADPGTLVALSPEGGAVTPLWSAPDAEGVSCVPHAVDGESRRMLLEVLRADGVGPAGTSLVMLGADGATTVLVPPEGYEGISSATFVGGRALVVVDHATPSTFDTLIGMYSDEGVWQEVPLRGTVPEHQFVEWVVAVPGTDVFAVLLKTPGGTGDRDDDALVLARLSDDGLLVHTDGFPDDSLPGASPLYGVEGVVYPRTWRVVDGSPVVDLVRARWTGTDWEEQVVVEAGAIASGIETGQVSAQDSDGVLWVRSVAEGAGSPVLLSLDPAIEGAEPMPTALVMDSIDWFTWVDAGDR
jgi:hypothetical protein